MRSDVAINTDNATELTAVNANEGSGGGDFDNQTDSGEARRDRGDVAWITGGGGALTEILNVQVLIPYSIDLADTAVVRIGLGLTNMVDDLPTTAEITPGTITIDRKAVGGTSWTNIVNAAACSELAGLIYYDEVFDDGTGYAQGDSIRITFKSQKITVSANDYEITGTDGWIFQTHIRQPVTTTGSSTATITVETGASAAIPDVTVQIWNSGATTFLTSGTTDASGDIQFALDDDTYTVKLKLAGWSFTYPETLVVSGTTTDTYIGTSTIPADPVSADACRVYDYAFMADGNTPVPFLQATAKITSLPEDSNSILHTGDEMDAIYNNSSGMFYWDIVKGATVTFNVPELGVYYSRTVAATSTARMTDLT